MKVVVGISWNELTVRVLRFTTEFDSAATEASHCLTWQTINFWVRCRCLKIFLASERWPASSAVGAALATATSRRQLWGLKALHILQRKPKYLRITLCLRIVKRKSMTKAVASCHQDSLQCKATNVFLCKHRYESGRCQVSDVRMTPPLTTFEPAPPKFVPKLLARSCARELKIHGAHS